MQITLHLDPSRSEWSRTVNVLITTATEPALDIHSTPQIIEPTAADLAALTQWLLSYLSPSLAEGKLPVSDHSRVLTLALTPRATVARGEVTAPVLPATPPRTPGSIPAMPSPAP